MCIKARNLFLTRRERIRFALKKRNPEKPRLVVFRSNQHIYAQLIDSAATIASASTLEKELGLRGASNNVEAARVIGKVIAERAKKLNISKIVFDRSGYIYHGRVKALADAARDAGLVF